MDDHLPQEASSDKDEKDVRKRINLKVNSFLDELNHEKFSDQDSLAVARLMTQKIIRNSANPP